MVARILILITIVLTQTLGLLANVTTNTGTVSFDVDADSNEEMILTADGLGIGTSSPSANLHVQGDSIVSEELSVGSSSMGTSTLYVSGSMGLQSVTLSSNAAIESNSLVFADSISGNVSLHLPYFSTVEGRIITIKKIHEDHLVSIFGGGNIEDYEDGFSLSSGNLGSVTLVATSEKWVVLDSWGTTFSSIDRFWSPAEISTHLWLDASDVSTIQAGVSDNVYQWDDRSGNGNHVAQSNILVQPINAGNTLNAHNLISFGLDDYLIKSTTVSSNISIFMVAEVKSFTNEYSSLFSFNSALDNDFQFDAGDDSNFLARLQVSGIGSPVTSSNGPYPGPSVYNVNLDYAGSEYNIYVDGSKDALDTYSTPLELSSNIHIMSNRGLSQQTAGEVGEFLVVLDDTTSLTRNRIQGYLAHKWGLEGNLPSDHSYQDTAPWLFPMIVSATVAGNAGGTSVVDPGDRITLVFDGSTNAPDVTTSSAVDALLSFGGNLLGGDYTGAWSNSDKTLTITISDNTNANVTVGQTVSVRFNGGLTFSGESYVSTDTEVLGGTWTGPTFSVYEGFQYGVANASRAGSSTLHNEPNGSPGDIDATGLSGTWTEDSETGNSLFLQSGSLSFGDLTTSGNHTRSDTNSENDTCQRPISADIDVSTELWFSLLANKLLNNFDAAEGGLVIGNQVVNNPRILLDTGSTGLQGFGVAPPTSGSAWSAYAWDGSAQSVSGSYGVAINGTQTVLLVGKIVWDAGTGGKDQYSLYYYTLNAGAIAGGALTQIGSTLEVNVDQTTLDTLSLTRQVNTAYDEIRMGTSLEDVTPY